MEGDKDCSMVYQSHGGEIPAIRIAPMARRLFFCANNVAQDEAKIFTSDMDGTSARILSHKVLIHVTQGWVGYCWTELD